MQWRLMVRCSGARQWVLCLPFCGDNAWSEHNVENRDAQVLGEASGKEGHMYLLQQWKQQKTYSNQNHQFPELF